MEITVLLGDEVVEVLEDLKSSLDGDVEYADIFKNAITFYHWALLQHREGRSIAATNDGKPVIGIDFSFKDD